MRRASPRSRMLSVAAALLVAAQAVPVARGQGGLGGMMGKVLAAPVQGRGVGYGRAKAGRMSTVAPGQPVDGAPWRIQARSMSHTTTGQGCNLNIVSVQTSKEGEGLDEYKALYHLGWFVGLKDVQQCTVQDANFEAADKVPDAPTNCRQDDAVQGRMMNPFNLPLRDVESHYLSCSDGRSQYAVVGSPGGDAVELIHGLNAMEKAIHMPLTPDGIDQLFKEFLEHMPSFGKQYFYMHTDAPAHEALHRAASVPDPPNPLDADARRKLVRVAGEPEHVGCSHLRALLEDESSFGVRRNLTEAVIQSFLGVYYNPFDKYRERLIYPVLHGEQKEQAVVNIASPEVCHPLTPMVVPQIHSAAPSLGSDLTKQDGEPSAASAVAGSGSGSGEDATVGTSVSVNHYVAASLFRRRIADFLAPKYGINPTALLAKMNRMAREYGAKMVEKDMADKPVYNVMFGP